MEGGGGQLDDGGFIGRGFGAGVDLGGDEGVGFRVVHEGVASADVEGADADVFQFADIVADVYALIFLQAHAGHVGGVDKDHIAPVLAAVDVFFFVNNGVELAFGADGHEAKLIRLQGS